MKFLKLVKIFEQLEQITSGNKMREILSNFFKKVPETDIDSVAYLTPLNAIANESRIVAAVIQDQVNCWKMLFIGD